MPVAAFRGGTGSGSSGQSIQDLLDEGRGDVECLKGEDRPGFWGMEYSLRERGVRGPPPESC